MDFAKFLKTPFLQNISRLLLDIVEVLDLPPNIAYFFLFTTGALFVSTDNEGL